MKRTREQIKAELLKQYEEELDRIMNWEENTKRPTLSQIEEQVLASRKKISEGILKELLKGQESQSPVEAVKCPKCGKAMEDKGKELKLVETRAGSLLMERRRYYCPQCKIGIFPPG
jgi:ssDNA-binding Zn-finger/Zn-ribbon topoisomerase 1